MAEVPVLQGQQTGRPLFSDNLLENALQVRRILRRRGWHKVLLVTSAQHMRRALAVFVTAGIDAIASPTDYEAVGQAEHTLLDWLPDASSLERSTLVLKKIVGSPFSRLVSIGKKPSYHKYLRSFQ